MILLLWPQEKIQTWFQVLLVSKNPDYMFNIQIKDGLKWRNQELYKINNID